MTDRREAHPNRQVHRERFDAGEQPYAPAIPAVNQQTGDVRWMIDTDHPAFQEGKFETMRLDPSLPKKILPPPPGQPKSNAVINRKTGTAKWLVDTERMGEKPPPGYEEGY